LFTSFGFGYLALAVICDCYRPGKTRAPDGVPRRLNRTFCGFIFLRGLIVPIILTTVLGLFFIGFTQVDDMCKSALAYCSTISCVCGALLSP
jgi:hypothetical protein